MLIVETHGDGYRIRCAQCAQRNPTTWIVRGPLLLASGPRLSAAIDAAIEHGTAQHQNIAELIENRAVKIDGDR